MKNIAAIIFAFCVIIISHNTVCAQVVPENENDKQGTDKIELQAEQDEDENVDYEELQLRLQKYSQNPLDLNRATTEEFKDFGLLTDLQINALQKHIDKNGNLISIEELQSVRYFDVEDIRGIQPYVNVGGSIDKVHIPFKTLITRSQKQLLLRSTYIVERAAGYKSTEGEPAKYLGSPYVLYVRYRQSYSKKYSIGITAEKDAGEEFFKGSQKNGFDYYSFHLVLNEIGKIKTLAIGDYQLSYGQGLTMWTGLAFGKSNDVSTLVRNPRGITPYTSVNEMQFNRGVAVAYVLNKFQFDLFVSHRKIDANIPDQSTDSAQGEITFSSILLSGLHRTNSELADKSAITQTNIGGHVSYKKRNLELGITAVNSQLDKPLKRTQYLYNQFQFEGDHFFNVGFDYKYVAGNKLFFGEVAQSTNTGGWAMTHGTLISLDPRLSMSLMYRNFQRDYAAISSNPVRESSVSNERGLLWGLTSKPVKGFSLAGYYDMFSFPWLRFRVDAPSSGYEYLAQLNYTPSKKMDMFFRFRHQQKLQNSIDFSVKQDYLVPYDQKNYRFNFSFKATPALSIRTRAEWTDVKFQNMTEHGFMLIQDVIVKPFGKPYSFNIRYVIFDTDGYNSRLYAYENDVYGTFSIPPYYFKGSRYYINFRYKMRKGLDLFVRYGNTLYTNRTTIGSANDEIQGSTKQDVRAALKFEF